MFEHVCASWVFRRQGKRKRFEHPALEIGRDVFHQVGREFKDRWFVKEAFDPNSVRGLRQVEQNRALQPLVSRVPYYAFNEEGELHRSAVLGSKPQLLVAQ
jgi:hypothetical protein